MSRNEVPHLRTDIHRHITKPKVNTKLVLDKCDVIDLSFRLSLFDRVLYKVCLRGTLSPTQSTLESSTRSGTDT